MLPDVRVHNDELDGEVQEATTMYVEMLDVGVQDEILTTGVQYEAPDKGVNGKILTVGMQLHNELLCKEVCDETTMVAVEVYDEEFNVGLNDRCLL